MDKGRSRKVQGDIFCGEKHKAYDTPPHSVQRSGPMLPASQVLLLRKMDATGSWFQKCNLKL